MKRAFEALLAVSAISAIISASFSGAGVAELYWVGVVASPLATFSAAMLASSQRDSVSANYRLLVLAGMTVALAGNFLPLFSGEHFQGELLYLAASQLVFVVAFAIASPFAERKIPFIAYALVISPLLATVFPNLAANFRLPVVLCTALTALAAAQSASWMLASTTRSARYAALGGAWMIVSISTLLIDRFQRTIPFHDAIVLTAYWIALWNIARSVSRTGDL